MTRKQNPSEPPEQSPAAPVAQASSLPLGAEQEGGSPPASALQIEPVYQVVSPLRHNGRRYSPGERLTDVTPPQAAHLLGLRVITEYGEPE